MKIILHISRSLLCFTPKRFANDFRIIPPTQRRLCKCPLLKQNNPREYDLKRHLLFSDLSHKRNESRKLKPKKKEEWCRYRRFCCIWHCKTKRLQTIFDFSWPVLYIPWEPKSPIKMCIFAAPTIKLYMLYIQQHRNTTYCALPLKFNQKDLPKTPRSSPVRARYGVSFVNSAFD